MTDIHHYSHRTVNVSVFCKKGKKLAITLICASLLIFLGAIYDPYLALYMLLLFTCIFPSVYYGLKNDLLNHPIVYVGGSFLFFYGIGSYDVYASGECIENRHVVNSILTIGGLVICYFTYYIIKKTFVNKKISLCSFNVNWNTGKAALIIVTLLIVGLGAVVVKINTEGGIIHLDREDPQYIFSGSNYGYSFAQWAIPLLSCPSVAIIMLFFCAIKGKEIQKTHILIWLFVLTLYLILFSYIGSRSRLINVLVITTIVYNIKIRKLSTIQVTNVFISILILYSVFGEIRSNLWSESETEVKNVREYLASSGDLTPYRSSSQIIKDFPEKYDHLLGTTLITPATMWIPRIVWTDKPDSAGAVFSKLYHTAIWEKVGGTGVPGFVGEMHMNYSYAGVILGMALVGFLCALLNRYLETNNQNDSAVIFYSMICFTLTFIARGDVLFVCVNFEIPFAITLVSLLLLKKRKVISVKK